MVPRGIQGRLEIRTRLVLPKPGPSPSPLRKKMNRCIYIFIKINLSRKNKLINSSHDSTKKKEHPEIKKKELIALFIL